MKRQRTREEIEKEISVAVYTSEPMDPERVDRLMIELLLDIRDKVESLEAGRLESDEAQER